jgi:hypothetical protein
MKINIWDIVRSHLATMRDFSTNSYSKADVLIFYGLPLLLSLGAIYFGWKFDAGVLNSLLTAFSIFAALLLNLLLLVFSFSVREQPPTMVGRIRASLMKELHDNVSYSILISIALVGIIMFEIARPAMQSNNEKALTGPISTAVITFLTLNFFFTLLMVLKRIYVILNHEIENPTTKKAA